MSFSCVKHPMTMGEYICGECGHQFCPECVVFPFGASKPPVCIACALELGGVRRQKVDRPKLARKSIKERLALQRTQSAVPTEPAPDAVAAGAAGSEPEDVEWLDGSVDAEDVPGGWSTSYP